MKKTIFMLLLVFSTVIYGQSEKIKISGKIVDENNQPLPGASILIKGTNNGAATDFEGAYAIQANAGSTLVFTFIGYDQKEIAVGNQTTINVKLTPTNNTLNEVVVVGYGTQKKSDVTGSVTSLSKERLSQLPVTNVLQSVQGAVAGVNVIQSSSAPGSGTSAQIRGASSISAATGPFIVLDGMPFSTTGGSLNDINPNDIESLEILKDASAVAIYGTRGANGVILITTKKGKSGKPVIKFNTYAGIEQFSNRVNPMGPTEYVQKYADWKVQSGASDTNVLPNLYEQQNYANGVVTDWMDQVDQLGKIQNYNVSISGGSESVKYYISGDLLEQKGVLKGYNFQRGSLRSNINAKITPYLDGGVNLFLTNNNYDGGHTNLTLAGRMSPYGSLYDANGDYEVFPMFGELVFRSPMARLSSPRNDRNQNITANAFFDLTPDFLPGFKYKLNVGYTLVPTQFQSYLGRKTGDLLGTAMVANSETRSMTVENIFNYNKSWKNHTIGVTGLYSAQQTDFFSSTTSASGFINDQLSFNNLSTASSTSASSQGYKSNLLSQMLRLNYSYASKYLFTATARRDGYSAFGSNSSKYGLFPSVALGWNISKEKFLENSDFVSNLKLRASYGLSGNQAINPNVTSSTATTVRLPFNGVSTVGVVANVLGNKDLTWESTLGTNVGLDFELFNKRISGTIDGYSTRTKDLLLLRAIPDITGYSKVLQNLGEVSNLGLEISLKATVLNLENFRWETSANFATNKNKIVDLYGDKKDDIGNRWFIGKPIGVVYDYKQVGIWQVGENPAGVDPTAKPGDIKFADTDGSGTITPADRVVLGQTAPKWTGGITNTFHYKDFHLNVFIQTAQGITKSNNLLDYRDYGGRQNLPAGVGYWTAANQNNTRPALSYTNTRDYNYPKDASYTRLKDVTLSYVANTKVLDKLHLGGLTIYMSGRNLVTWTKWFGWDPEADFDKTLAFDTNSYPLTSVFTIGTNITLK
ncbi:SusC/RagA family TonB-linked outer membrane protein [Flavobacterium sp. XS2P12]|uniref:SusC/RagA family TonB-linked outer membrane protein n=1 Tax=Flavobacterium melibiosi TaxID=3398734 RepID=UPI003A86E9D8